MWGDAAALVASLALALPAVARRLDERRVLGARVAILAVALGLGVVAPLGVLAAERVDGRVGSAQSEVNSVESMGDRLGHGRSPYPTAAAIEAEAHRTGAGFKAYRPYEPAMAVFGLPRAWLGKHTLTDVRVMFLLVVALSLAAACSVTSMTPRDSIRGVQLLAVLPPTALTIATGGDDMPVIALCLLALALASRRRWTASGVAMGVGLAMKVIVAPLAVLLLVAAWRWRGEDHDDAPRPGWRRYALGAVGVPVVAMVPFVAWTPAAFFENVVRYPLGLARFHSSAASALPGHWITEHAAGGRTVAIILLFGVVATAAWWIARRPARSVADIATQCAVVVGGAILMLPASRFGYLLYPICLLGWARILNGNSARPVR